MSSGLRRWVNGLLHWVFNTARLLKQQTVKLIIQLDQCVIPKLSFGGIPGHTICPSPFTYITGIVDLG